MALIFNQRKGVHRIFGRVVNCKLQCIIQSMTHASNEVYTKRFYIFGCPIGNHPHIPMKLMSRTHCFPWPRHIICIFLVNVIRALIEILRVGLPDKVIVRVTTSDNLENLTKYLMKIRTINYEHILKTKEKTSMITYPGNSFKWNWKPMAAYTICWRLFVVRSTKPEIVPSDWAIWR